MRNVYLMDITNIFNSWTNSSWQTYLHGTPRFFAAYLLPALQFFTRIYSIILCFLFTFLKSSFFILSIDIFNLHIFFMFTDYTKNFLQTIYVLNLNYFCPSVSLLVGSIHINNLFDKIIWIIKYTTE